MLRWVKAHWRVCHFSSVYANRFGGALIMYGGRYEQWFGALAPRDTTSSGIVTLSVGREDFLLGANRHFVAWLESRGTRLELEEVSGGHTWSVWRRELIRLAPRLFRDGGGV